MTNKLGPVGLRNKLYVRKTRKNAAYKKLRNLPPPHPKFHISYNSALRCEKKEMNLLGLRFIAVNVFHQFK
jgi:hypothetical protein